MQSITLAPAHVHSIASIATAATKESVTPILEHVQLSVAAGALTAMATDRYRVVRVQFDLPADEKTGEVATLEPVAIPAALLVAFSKALKAAKVGPALDVTLTVDEGRVTLAHVSGVQLAGDLSLANFPPVGRLIDGYKPGDVRDVILKPAFMADASKFMLPSDPTPAAAKDAGWNMRFSDAGKDKPGPVMLSRSGYGATDRIEYMVQPNLNRS